MGAGAGLVLQSFRGIRYDPSGLDLAAVTCPPYDVIGSAEAERLAASEPHNLVHLTLAAATAPPEQRYAGAGARWRQWQVDGVLRRDAAPALYVYEARHGEHRQFGLVGAVGLRAPEERVILPHEDVHPGPVADRLAQMQATDANLEPIFLVVPGFGGAGEVVARATAAAPLVDVDAGETTYRLWAITDQDALATVASALRDQQALIADGHHRYTAYRQLQAARHADGRGAGPWDFGLAFVVDSDSYPPALQPIHRVAAGTPPSSVLATVPPGVAVIDLGEHLEPALAYAHRRDGTGHPVVMAGDGRYRLVTLPADPADTQHCATWRELDVTALQRWLADALRIPDEQLRFPHSATEAVTLATQTSGTAFLLNPPSVTAVHAIAAAGDRMPRKSTSFGPKPLGGLVMRSLAAP